ERRRVERVAADRLRAMRQLPFRSRPEQRVDRVAGVRQRVDERPAEIAGAARDEHCLVHFFVVVNVPDASSSFCPLARSAHVPFAAPASNVAAIDTSAEGSSGKSYFAVILLPSNTIDVTSAL